MRTLTLVAVLGLLAFTSCIPFRDQISLLNSLQVGRDEEPMVWECYGCDQSTKPASSIIIEEPEKDLKAILSVYDQYTVLAFRYTATMTNIFQDIVYAIQVQDEHACSGCKVQQAYDNMWNAVKQATLEQLRQASHTKRLIITGISLGGGLACISYVDIAHSGIFDDVEVVTFGAPRVGNKKWAEWFDNQTPSTRYYITTDPIVDMPRCLTLLCNYQQTGTPIGCNRNTEVCSQSNSIWNTNIMEEIRHIREEHKADDENLGDILDHIQGYKFIKDYALEA